MPPLIIRPASLTSVSELSLFGAAFAILLREDDGIRLPDDFC